MKDGTTILLKIGSTIFSGLIDNSYTHNVDTVDITTKDSLEHKEYLAGEDDGDYSVSALYNPAGEYTLEHIFSAAKLKSNVTLIIGGITDGDDIITASCVITSVEWTNGKNAASGVSASFKKSGDAVLNQQGEEVGIFDNTFDNTFG